MSLHVRIKLHLYTKIQIRSEVDMEDVLLVSPRIGLLMKELKINTYNDKIQ